jgi:hypothetical protein
MNAQDPKQPGKNYRLVVIVLKKSAAFPPCIPFQSKQKRGTLVKGNIPSESVNNITARVTGF